MDRLLALLRDPAVRKATKRAIAAVVALAAAITALAAAVDTGTPTPPPPAPTPAATVQLDGPGHTSIPAPKPADTRTAAVGLADHAGSRWDAPLPADVAERRQDGIEQLERTDQLPLTSPDAAPTVPGCTSRFVRNFSSRGGVAPRELVAHYTVSRNRPGWDDVWAIVSLFDRAAFAASSTFVIDGEGHCAYIVRDTDKAWTQASANPFSVSIEFVAMGDEGGLSAAALAKGGSVFAYEARKWGIPVRLGRVSNCLPSTPGIVDHAMLGACGGGHHDLKPFAGAAASDAQRLAPLIAAVQLHTRRVTSVDRVTCRKLNWWRAHGRPHGKAERNAIRRRDALTSRGVRCLASGPVVAG